MQIINNVFEQRAERKSKTFARLCYSTPTVPGTVGVVSNVEHRGHRKKWRTPGFRSPYQPSQHKFSGTHTGVERPVEGGLALGSRRARVVDLGTRPLRFGDTLFRY